MRPIRGIKVGSLVVPTSDVGAVGPLLWMGGWNIHRNEGGGYVSWNGIGIVVGFSEYFDQTYAYVLAPVIGVGRLSTGELSVLE